jgi:hypothetical protein
MNKKTGQCVVWMSIGLLTFSNSWAGAGLAGHFLVGPDPGTDFPDLASALGQIELQGIDDDVHLLLTPGTHDTHVQINPITLTGNTDARLLITSEDELDMAVLRHTPTSDSDNWIIRINQATQLDLVGLAFKIEGNRDLTTAVVFDGGGDDINLIDNIFEAHPVAVQVQQEDVSLISQLNETRIDGLQIVGNHFIQGGAALYLESDEINGLQDIKVSDNQLMEQTARGGAYLIYLKRVLDLDMENNQVINDSVFANGILLHTVNDLQFRRNQLQFTGGESSFALRMLTSNMTNPTLSVISNNFIQATEYGIQLTGQNAAMQLFNNTVVMAGNLSNTSSFTSAIQSNGSQVGQVTMRGNVLINRSTATNTRIISVSNSDMFAEVNNNLMYDTDGGSFVLDGTLYDDLAAYQTGTGLDQHSLFRDLPFIDEGNGDLHLHSSVHEDAELLIPANPEVTMDVDGAIRATDLHRVGADDLPIPDVIFADAFE